MKQSDATPVEFMQYHINIYLTQRAETYHLAKDLSYVLITKCQAAVTAAYLYNDVPYPTAPLTIIDA